MLLSIYLFMCLLAILSPLKISPFRSSVQFLFLFFDGGVDIELWEFLYILYLLAPYSTYYLQISSLIQ